jgi:UDP:flavonoid glycosyltransferase YjiC (YdhE family)
MSRAGIPHVVLPLWADLYNYAALAETSGVGVWGCKDTTPDWTSQCLTAAFLEVVVGDHGRVLKKFAEELGERVQAGRKGRDIAADEVAKLAYVL